MPVDTDKPAELLLFDFFTDEVAAIVDEDDPLFEIELHDTIYQDITKKRGLRIGDAVGDMTPDGDDVREYNVNLQIACWAKIEGKNIKERAAAMTAVWRLQKAVYKLLFEKNSLGGRVCDCLPDTGARGYENFDGNPYAVAVIPLTINPAEGS